MDRETTIEYMRKAVACHNEDNTACLGRNCCDCPHDYPVDTIELIESALELLEQDRWIPVTERLPEPVKERTLEDEYVLISKKPTKLSGSKWSVAIAIRTADPRSGKIQWRDSGFGIIQDDKVLAWRQLPAPYQEEES